MEEFGLGRIVKEQWINHHISELKQVVNLGSAAARKFVFSVHNRAWNRCHGWGLGWAVMAGGGGRCGGGEVVKHGTAAARELVFSEHNRVRDKPANRLFHNRLCVGYPDNRPPGQNRFYPDNRP